MSRKGRYYDEELGCYRNRKGEIIRKKSKKKAKIFLTVCLIIAVATFAAGMLVSVVMRSDMGMGIGSALGVGFFFAGIIGSSMLTPAEQSAKQSLPSDAEIEAGFKRVAEIDKRMKDLEKAQNDYLIAKSMED